MDWTYLLIADLVSTAVLEAIAAFREGNKEPMTKEEYMALSPTLTERRKAAMSLIRGNG